MGDLGSILEKSHLSERVNRPQDDPCTSVCSRRAVVLVMTGQDLGAKGHNICNFFRVVQHRKCLFLDRLQGAQKRDKAATLNTGESS